MTVRRAGYTIGSLFSGIGGLDLGLEMAGLGPVLWHVEAKGYCQRLLKQHWRGTTVHHDIRSIASNWLSDVDVLCGGFPCQDISGAGKGAGLAGERSGLWRQFARIVKGKRPRWVVVENVNSGAKRWVDDVCAELVELGYAPLPVPLSAADVGAPHLRQRVFIIARRVPSPERVELRHERQRQPWRLARRVRAQGHPEPQHDGEPRDVANANGARQLRKPRRQGYERRRPGDSREALADPDGERCDRGPSVLETAEQAGRAHAEGSHEGWAVEPAVGRVAHGVPRRMDRIAGLGNAVVPQCAEVIGHMLMLLDDERLP